MKAPITSTVRIKIDAPSKVVTWMADVEGSLGEKDRQIDTFGGEDWSRCEIFDDRNWRCNFLAADGEAVIVPEMKDGKLTRYYFGTTEVYEQRTRIFGHNF